ncbi:MAG: hypothetical protein ABJG33_00080 [Balneola sp.]
MSATYDVTTHPLLSEKAKALFAESPSVFDAVVEACERILGLHDTSFTGSKEEDAKLAIVLQLNFELEKTSEADIYDRLKRGNREFEYKDNISAIQPTAGSISDRLLNTIAKSVKSRTVLIKNEYGW